MVLYKQVILTNLKSSPAETAKMFQELSGFLLGRGGVVRDLANRGHRVLGYPIDDRRWGGTFERHREAKLVVKTFETNPTTLKELEAKMKLSYPVLRFMTFKVDKDPLRNVLKQATAEPAIADEASASNFSWEQFQASLNDNVKVVRTDYIADERNDPMANMNIANYVSEDADDDDDDAEVDDEDEPLTAQQQEMADWLVEKAGKSDILKTEEIIHALENATKPAKSDNVEYWDDDDFDFEDDDSAQDKNEKVEHDWQKDSSYVPPVPRPTKK